MKPAKVTTDTMSCECVVNKNKVKVWKIIHNTYDESTIGEITTCGLPHAKDFPVGTIYSSIINIFIPAKD